MATVEELSDRLEIQDLITAYSYAVDFHRFDDCLEAGYCPPVFSRMTPAGGSQPLNAIYDFLSVMSLTFNCNLTSPIHLSASSSYAPGIDSSDVFAYSAQRDPSS